MSLAQAVFQQYICACNLNTQANHVQAIELQTNFQTMCTQMWRLSLVTAQAQSKLNLFCHILIAVAGFYTLIRTDYGGDHFLQFIYSRSRIIIDGTRNSAAYCYTQQISASKCTYRTLRGKKSAIRILPFEVQNECNEQKRSFHADLP